MMTGRLQVHAKGAYRGWYTTDGVLWDYYHNAVAHQRWLNFAALLNRTSEQTMLSKRDIENAMQVDGRHRARGA